MVTTSKNLMIKLIKLVLYFLCILFFLDRFLPFFNPPSFPSSSPFAAASSSLNSSSSISSTCYVLCSLSCIVLKNDRHLSSCFLTSSRSISIKCLSSSSLFLSTLVATGNIKHKEIVSEADATISR